MPPESQTQHIVDFSATPEQMAALADAFVREWIDSPEWVEHWFDEPMCGHDGMQSNLIAADPQRIVRIMGDMQADGSWLGIDYRHQSRENWNALRHFTEKLHPLAVAYGSGASPLRNDPALRNALLCGIDFWLVNDFQNPNWWYQYIGLPAYFLGPILLTVRGHLTEAHKSKAAHILSRCDLKRHDQWRTGGNCLYDCRAGLLYALNVNDAELVSRIYSRMLYKELHVTPPEGSGVKEDFSQWEHGNLLFNHGYGAVLLVEGGRLMDLARQAQIPIDSQALEFLSSYLLEGSQWMTRGKFFDPAADGRGIASPASSKGTGTVGAAKAGYMAIGARHLINAGASRSAELQAVIDRALDKVPPLSGNRLFPISDFLVHHRPDFYVSIRGYSRRTLNTEICNGTNRLGHHLGEGSMYLISRGDEYADIFPTWNWLHVPGTTVNVTSLDDAQIDENPDSGWFPSLEPEEEGFGRARLRVSRTGRTRFVGGVSNGGVGAFCLDLQVLSLRARKSWICIDTGIVCLGSGITDPSPERVVTTVNQCRLTGAVHAIDIRGASRELPTGLHRLTDLSAIWHDGVVYLFSPGQQVVCSNQLQRGNWRRINVNRSDETVEMPVFTLWIEHGERPSGASYCYQIIPGVSQGQAKKVAAEQAITVLANTHVVHAARDNRSGDVTAIFYQPGVLDLRPGRNVLASHPCALILQESERKLSIADPTQTRRTISIGSCGTQFMHFASVDGGRTTVMDWKFE